MEPFVGGFVEELVRNLRRETAPQEAQGSPSETTTALGTDIEMDRAVQFFTLSVVTCVAFGKELGYPAQRLWRA